MRNRARYRCRFHPQITPLLVVIAVLTGSGVAIGNGGGYQYGVKFSGTVAPFEPEGTDKVQIVDENLDIELGEASARVTVRYRLKNLADGRSKVKFGFPVESIPVFWIAEGEKPPTQTELTGKYCHDYQVTVNGSALKSRFVEEPFAAGKVKAFPGSEVLEGIAGWMVSELSFAGSEELSMTISFRSDYEIKGVSVSSDSRSQAPLFRYRLSTGGVWAGPIARGKVTVHCSDQIEAGYVTIKSPANRFKKVGDAWVMEFTDLEPTLADDLTVIAGSEEKRYSDHTSYDEGRRRAKFIQRGDRWQRNHQDFSVTASSTLPKDGRVDYDCENLYGYDWEKKFYVWCEGADGHGIGEKLTLQIEKHLPLDAIVVRPGYGLTEELFQANGRPSKVEVVLNGEHRFVASLADEDRRQTILIRDYDKPVETVELIIADVFEGSRHRDTCIAEVRVVSALAEAPKRYGAR